jgi:hypothetical protein
VLISTLGLPGDLDLAVAEFLDVVVVARPGLFSLAHGLPGQQLQ